MTETPTAQCPKPPAAGLFGAGCTSTAPAPLASLRHIPSPSQRKGFQELFRDDGGTHRTD